MGRQKERESMGKSSANGMRGKQEAERSPSRRRMIQTVVQTDVDSCAGAGLSIVRSVRTMPNVRDNKQLGTDLESKH
jgi:hypothetical protein